MKNADCEGNCVERMKWMEENERQSKMKGTWPVEQHIIN
jgi:hypothetical protein